MMATLRSPWERVPGVVSQESHVKFSRIAATLLAAAVLAGCTGTPMKTQTYTPEQYTVVGHGEGKATGLLLFGFIPIQQNDRFVRAQNAAVNANAAIR